MAEAEAEVCAAAAVLETEGVWFGIDPEGEEFGRGPIGDQCGSLINCQSEIVGHPICLAKVAGYTPLGLATLVLFNTIDLSLTSTTPASLVCSSAVRWHSSLHNHNYVLGP